MTQEYAQRIQAMPINLGEVVVTARRKPKGFTIRRGVPGNAQNCSAPASGANFNAPPGFSLPAIVAAGQKGGGSPLAIQGAVGRGGTFDYQRVSSGGGTTFLPAYTNAANFAVGAYLYGAGYSRQDAFNLPYTFAMTMSSNAGSIDQSTYWMAGWDAAEAAAKGGNGVQCQLHH